MHKTVDRRPVLIYCRESRDENGESYERIETQRDILLDFCRRRGLVNVVDVKSDCGFYFPAIIKDKEVVISVSTGGQSPVLAGTIKRNIESHLGRSYGDIAERMGELREQIKAQIDGEEERKKAFRQMVRSLLDES